MNEASSLSSSDKRVSKSDYSIEGHDVVADIERRLAELLSKVEGAGQVSVMVYADTGSEQVLLHTYRIQEMMKEPTEIIEISETSSWH